MRREVAEYATSFLFVHVLLKKTFFGIIAPVPARDASFICWRVLVMSW